MLGEKSKEQGIKCLNSTILFTLGYVLEKISKAQLSQSQVSEA